MGSVFGRLRKKRFCGRVLRILEHRRRRAVLDIIAVRNDVELEGPLGIEAGGEGGIRTLDTVSRIHAFQACAFNHSATSPSHGVGEDSTIGADAPAEGLHSSV